MNGRRAGGVRRHRFAHGLSLGRLMACVLDAFGGHVNPAVSFGLCGHRAIPWSMALDRTSGPASGRPSRRRLLVTAVFPADVWHGLASAPCQWTVLTLGQGVALEAVLTFLVVVVYLAARAGPTGPGPSGRSRSGAVLTLSMLVGGPLTGA